MTGSRVTKKRACGLAALCIILVLLLVEPPAADASQQPGHIYLALESLGGLSPEMWLELSTNLGYYTAGATGPDICLVSYPAREYLEWEHPGAMPHYQQSGRLIVNMIRRAEYGGEKAFAMGWLTHYLVDNTLHPLVNEFGGYYTGPGALIGAKDRHIALELFESKHVFYAHVLPHSGLSSYLGHYVVKPEKVPNTLISRAFIDTYAPGRFSWNRVRFSLPVSLENCLSTGAFAMNRTTDLFVLHGSGSRRDWYSPVKFIDSAVQAVLGRRMPTTEEYLQIMDPLRIISVSQAGGEEEEEAVLRVEYRVNDTRLLKAFADAWDEVHFNAIHQIGAAFAEYQADPVSFSLPDMNLDTGLPEGQLFRAEDVFPGNPEIRQLLVFCRITDTHGIELAGWDPLGQWVSLPNLAERIWDGPAGTGVLEIPFLKSAAGPYRVELAVAFARDTDRRPYGIRDEWSGLLGEAAEEPERWTGYSRITTVYEGSGLTLAEREQVVGHKMPLDVLILRTGPENCMFSNPTTGTTWEAAIRGNRLFYSIQVQVDGNTLLDEFEGTIDPVSGIIAGTSLISTQDGGAAYSCDVFLERQ